MRRLAVGAMVAAVLLGTAAFAIAQITNGVPSANIRSGSPTDLLAGGWDRQLLASGAQPLENPAGIFTQYGYLNDAGASVPACVTTPQTSGLKTKTEPDQNTYLTTTSNPGGPAAGYDYGRHFLVQGHEVFSNTGNGFGQTNAAYITRINLDVPLHDSHRITLLGFPAGADNCNSGMASLDGSTYDPFSGELVLTGEAGGTSASSVAYGGVYKTPLNWSGTSAPAVDHSGLQQSFGHAGYEGVQMDDKGNLILEEDTSGPTVSSGVKKGQGYIYRFVPSDPSDLTEGMLQALQVSVDGTPLTFANQDPINGGPDKRLYTGETLQAQWVNVHDSTVASPPANFDANAEAAAANATPFKRPENGRFVPGSGFKSFVFTSTGDTAANAIAAQPDRGAAGTVFRIDMPSSGASTGTVKAIIPGDGDHASYDSITFLDKNTLLVGEDRGDALHASYNALDSTWSFDLTKPFDQQLASAERLIAQGRDQSATDDANKHDAGQTDQNDGDNEVTGVLVSDGISTVSDVFGSHDPADGVGTRAFYTGQHGDNVTWQLIPPGADSSKTSPGVIGPPGPVGQDGQDGQDGQNGTNGTNGVNETNGQNGATGPQGNVGPAGAQGPAGPEGARGPAGRDGLTIVCTVKGKKVTCATAKRSSAVKASTAARLMRGNRTYAKGTLRSMRSATRIKRGSRFTLVLGKGSKARKLPVRLS